MMRHILTKAISLIDNADWALLAGSVTLLFATIMFAGTGFGRWGGLIGGIAGAFICGRYLTICLRRPIARDRMLVKGHFIMKVITFVVLIPFVITALVQIGNFGCELLKGERWELKPTDLITSEEVAANQNDANTAGIILAGQNNEDNSGSSKERASLFWNIYYHFVNPGSQHLATSKGRGLAGLIAIIGIILLNGLLISTLTSWFERRRNQWANGEIRYKRKDFRAFKDPQHKFGGDRIAIVIGANENAPAVIHNLLSGKGETGHGIPYYVILLTDECVQEVRDRIASYLNEEDSERLVIYNGQLDSVEEIKNIPVEQATEIYVLGESKSGATDSYHDSLNMKCVHNIANQLSQRNVGRRIVCRVQFDFQTTYSVFQFSDLPKNVKERLDFIPFNCYENWAEKVLVDGEYSEKGKEDCEYRVIKYAPLDGEGITADSELNVHLVVVGMTKMGIAVAIQAAQLAHFPNFRIGDSNPRRTRITFIDPNAENEMNFFKGRFQNLFKLARHRYLNLYEKDYNLDIEWNDPMRDETNNEYNYLGNNFLDIEWEFIKGSVADPGVRDYLNKTAKEADTPAGNGKSILTVAVCNQLSNEAIAEGIYMPESIYDKAQQILVYQKESSEILYNLYFDEAGASRGKRYYKLRPFGMQDADFTANKSSLYTAMLCNYVYCTNAMGSISKLEPDDIKSNLDGIIDNVKAEISKCSIPQDTEDAMKPARDNWNNLSIFDKWSNRYLANSFKTKLRSIGYNGDNYGVDKSIIEHNIEKSRRNMAECEHNRWNIQQLLMGFRAYTETENDEYHKALTGNGYQAAIKDYKKPKQKGREKAHLDIRAYSQLSEYDPHCQAYDEVFNASIPEILSVVESQKNCQPTT